MINEKTQITKAEFEQAIKDALGDDPSQAVKDKYIDQLLDQVEIVQEKRKHSFTKDMVRQNEFVVLNSIRRLDERERARVLKHALLISKQ
jgi:hypothetical protein